MKSKRIQQPARQRPSLLNPILPLRRALNLAILTILYPAFSHANPDGAQIVNGQVSIDTATPGVTTITNSPNAIINWQNFSIAQNELTRFIQQNGQSAVLNRIIGQNPSEILGQLASNGKVFLINPNGIVFGPNAVVDTQGLVASSLNLSDQDFLTGNYHFMAGSTAGNIVNEGIIRTGQDGNIVLIAPQIDNNGILRSEGGTITLAAGHELTITSLDDPEIRFQIQAPADQVVNLGQLLSEGGAINVFAGTIKHSGEINADSVEVDAQGNIRLVAQQDITLEAGSSVHADGLTGGQSGQITMTAAPGSTAEPSHLYQMGEVHANGADGGRITLKADHILSANTVSADGQHTGGTVQVEAANRLLATAAAQLSARGGDGVGGNIKVSAGQSLYTSARHDVTGATGGTVHVLGNGEIKLAGAQVDASGDQGGGSIRVGGGFHGKESLAQAQTTHVNGGTTLKADARSLGQGGSVVTWSQLQTRFSGSLSAQGGALGGNGGLAEVSSKETLNYGGSVNLTAAAGKAGTLLLDPKNILITAGSAGVSAIELVDPTPGAGNLFGSFITPLTNGNLVVADPYDDFGAADAGAVYLFNPNNGQLLSTLTGSTANDYVGGSIGEGCCANGVTALANGNFLVRSSSWDNSAAANAGAVTWGSGTTGISGVVSSANSLIGGSAGDIVGSDGITVLSNGNYLVSSLSWDNGAATDAGAVTWGSGTTGVSGVVSAANSLVGSTAVNQVGFSGITELSNGNYLVRSAYWDNGAATDAGAVTWGSGTAGVSGVVSSANSLVGSSAFDYVGEYITELINGNYLVNSYVWDNGATTDVGAVTWGNGATGVSGVVSSSNSLVGSTTGDFVGMDGITELSNGNYLVKSLSWNNGAATDAGAVTWGSGTAGISGVVSSANSLVGSSANDWVGYYGITELSNGNYLVNSYYWDNGAATNAGAVTWGSGTTGISGVVSSANSLVGSTAGDSVGSNGITALNNGNYLVSSRFWDNGAATNAGAVTWGSGTAGISGVVSSANSLVGGSANNEVGYSSITELSNGNYLVSSSSWDNGAATNAGAVTWGSGTAGISGVVSSANSLVGSTAGDSVGSNGITALNNGNYLVSSSFWNNGAATDAGAVTWGSGTTGISGVISSANSLVGGSANDRVGAYGITELSNGNYLVRSTWNNGRGSVTWGSGTTGISGVVSSSNSLVGSSANDQVGSITLLSNGNYLVRSIYWSNGAATNAGAVTWGNGTAGISGVVSSANSLVGSSANDYVGLNGITALNNGNYLVRSLSWDNGAATDAGAVTWGSGTAGISGVVSSANSLVGGSAGDEVGYGGVTALSNGNYLVNSYYWDNGAATNAGAVTWGSGTAGISGVVSSANSLVGSSANDQVGDITLLSNGNYLVSSYYWDNGAATDAGAVTWGSGTAGISGVVSSANSLVGSMTYDYVGYDGITELSNGNYVVSSSEWNGGRGAVTWGNGTTGISGVVSSTNSLVGSMAGDQVGYDGITELSNDNYLVTAPYAGVGALSNAGRVFITNGGTSSLTGNLLFSDDASGTSTLSAAAISNFLSSGTALTLQANNDITLQAGADILVNNPSGNGGSFILQAGRSILLNANITTDGGSVTLIANDTLANGVADAHRDPGTAVIYQAAATYIDAGLGNIAIEMRNGAGKTYTDAGIITLAGLSGQDIEVKNFASGTAANILLQNGSYESSGSFTLQASSNIIQQGAITAGSNYNITLAANSGNYINTYGASALNVSGTGRWLIYSSNPANNTLGGLTPSFKHYGCHYVSGCADGYTIPASGNSLLYSITPILSVTPGTTTSEYGKPVSLAGLTYTLTGYIDGDTAGSANVTGTAGFSTAAGTASSAGSYNISYSGGLSNSLGYTIADNAASTGEYTITPVLLTLLTVTADNATRVYGEANPVFTGAITSGALANGDTLSSIGLTYSTLATPTSNVGLYAITPKITSTNYTLTGVDGQLTITPRALTVTAIAASKTYGALDPVLNYEAKGFVNDETSSVLTGALSRAPGETVAGGPYAITQGSLASNNYSIAYTGADFTIKPLASVAWVGGNGNWSTAGNWADNILPTSGNVLSATIPAGVTVTYNADAGNTYLNSLSSLGHFQITGGNLGIGGSFSTAQYTQTGGSLTADSFTVSDAFNQTGGVLAANNIFIHAINTIAQDVLGNINAANLTANSQGDVRLSGTNRITGVMSINAGGNIYSRTQGVSRISSLNASNGWIDVENIGGFILGSTALNQGTTVANAAGDIMIKAKSPLTINGAVTSTGGSVGLTASNGDMLAINAPISAPNGITLAGGTLNGSYANSYLQYLNTGTGIPGSTSSTTETLNNMVTDSTEQVTAVVLGTTPQSGQLVTDEPDEPINNAGSSTDDPLNSTSGKNKNSKQCAK